MSAAAAPPAGASPGELPQPADAAAFSRRGTAFAARREFDRAIVDLTRACEMAPTEPDYFFERGIAYMNNRQPFRAMADFDQVLKLKPNEVRALVARAQMRLVGRDNSGAVADLDAADRAAPREADIRLGLGEMYGRAGLVAPAISQLDIWIGAHDHDVRMAEGLNARCWTRATWGQELRKALEDCTAALKLRPGGPNSLDNRGLVELRMGSFDKAIADYTASLSIRPKSAWSLYGRGLGELRLGHASEGQADLAAATSLQPGIADEYRRRGLTP
jgi:tetratricopeptide (TPR) repeat protein